MKFDKAFGTVEGPLGLPCLEEQAKALDALLKSLPAEDREIRKAALPAALTTLEIGERADVSWISTESVGRHGEIVLAKGVDDTRYTPKLHFELDACRVARPESSKGVSSPTPFEDSGRATQSWSSRSRRCLR